MTLKALVTGVAAAALVAAAAGGMTSIAASTSAAPAVAPVVFGIPMPEDPAPELQTQLQQTLNALGAGGSFSGKSQYIEGLGRFTGNIAQGRYDDLVKKGYFPLTTSIDPTTIDVEGNSATAFVSATTANGKSGSMPLTFVQGPSPTGWQLSRDSLSSLGAVA